MARERMPNLQMDEVLLLVDTYFKLQNEVSSSQKMEYIENLSNQMRSLPFFPDLKVLPEFRSCSGMRMCLSNVKCCDPGTNGNFEHGSKKQQLVLDYYYGKRDLLSKYVNCILNCSRDEKFKINYAYCNYIGGMIVPSFHENFEQTDNYFIRLKNELIISGKTVCSICGDDLSKKYCNIEEMLELHVNTAFENVYNKSQISANDVIIVCPNCHKLLHSRPERFTADVARKMLLK